MTMKKLYALILQLAAFPLACFSQVEMRDSLSIGHKKPDSISFQTLVKPDSVGFVHRPEYNYTYSPNISLFPYRIAQPFELYITHQQLTPGYARPFRWGTGAIIASGSTRSFPGLMQIDNGMLGISQSFGNFTFYAGGVVNKYGYFSGLRTQYGLNSNFTYQFSPQLSATLFGDYYFGQPPRMANGMPMPPSMIGYYGRSTFGVSLDYQINERWGVETGVQTVQQVGTHRYEAEPIITPYYKISKKVAIDLPVGQILYHILKK